MMKKACLLLVLVIPLVLQGVSTWANPSIMNLQVKGKKVHHVTRNGQQVNNCMYCHSGTPIKQMPGQNYRKGQANFLKLRALPKCGGSGCHN
ncbi:MAG: hypothetical protein JXA20_18415 [Spirochaetes bacterium]|nr:hypothetical protein [Spirochaetota bacterium]